MEEVIWKSINIRGLDYEVNQYGDVKGKRGLLKSRLNIDGYPEVTVGIEKKRTTMRVHRLVATLFVENPNNLPEVNHKDFNRENNSMDNLEWVTHTDNIAYSIKAGRHISQTDMTGENNPNYGNDTLKKKYEREPELRMKNSRKGAINGRARKVLVYCDDFSLEFNFIGECAEWLIQNKYTKSNVNSIRTNITKSIKSNKEYLGLKYKFI